MPRQSRELKPMIETNPNTHDNARLAASEVTRYMKNTQPPDNTMLSTAKVTYSGKANWMMFFINHEPRKNFLPNLSICTIVQTFPGKADIEIRNELRNTSLLGTQSVVV